MSQTAYNYSMDVAVSGLLVEASGGAKSIGTWITPDDEIPFGRGVVKKSGDANGVVLPTGGSDRLEGIALYDPKVEAGAASVENAYPADTEIAVLKRGKVWVEVDQNVTPDDAVYCRYTVNGGSDQLGIFRADGDSSKAFAVTAARFLTAASAGGLAQLEINIP